MSIFTESHAVVFVADYASGDAAGKINALGVGFRVTGVQPNGLTPPQTVVVLIDVPSKYIGDEFPVSVDLRRDDTGELVKMQGPTGQAEAMRIQQMVKVEAASVPGVYIPSGLASRVQLVYAFATGLALQPGVTYRWGLEIEGQANKNWRALFHVAGPPPPPVLGGPGGSTDPTLPPLG